MTINPNSLQNLVAGKNKRPNALRKQVKLNPETIEFAKQLGEGKLSRGIDKMAEFLSDWVQVTKHKITNDHQYNITKKALEGCQKMLEVLEVYPIPGNENNRPFFQMRIDKLRGQINNYLEEIADYENRG